MAKRASQRARGRARRCIVAIWQPECHPFGKAPNVSYLDNAHRFVVPQDMRIDYHG